MASGFFALFDDIASLLDDVAALAKVAAGKTAGVLGDDLALNAQQVAGVHADRELPVVWAVAKGSLLNKAILIPAALVIAVGEDGLRGAGFDWPLITSLLMVGGAYLCYEGVEKLAHKVLHGQGEEDAQHAQWVQAVADGSVDLVAFEHQKIRGAIRTDFVLSAEIIVIALGTVATQPFMTQLGVLIAIGLAMTIGVYGVVAGIVKLDDLGLHLTRTGAGRSSAALGRIILAVAPRLMTLLSVVGTAAMFLVGGGILIHGISPLHHLLKTFSEGWMGWVVGSMASMLLGLLAGAVVLAVVTGLARIRKAGAMRAG